MEPDDNGRRLSAPAREGDGPEDPGAELLALASRFMTVARACHAEVSVTIDAGGFRATMSSAGVTRTAPGGPADPRLRTIHRKLLAATTSIPTSAKHLATRAGYSRCHSHVRQALTDLDRWQLVHRTPDGYKLPAGKDLSPPEEDDA